MPIARRCAARAPVAVWLVLLAAAGTFALTMGARQSMGLFLSTPEHLHGPRHGSISLAFASASCGGG